MSREQPVPVIHVSMKELEELFGRVQALISQDDFKLLKELLGAYLLLMKLVRERGATIARLRKLFGTSPSSEKLARLTGAAEPQTPPPNAAGQGEAAEGQAGDGDTQPAAGSGDDQGAEGALGSDEASKPADDAEGKKKKKVKGHGRVPASAYVAANHVPVPHASLHPGDRCPDGCGSGKVYQLQSTAPIVRIFGQAPLVATVWDCEKMRCGTCGKVYTARAPEEAQGEKYDATAGSIIAILCYGEGTPFYRLANLQKALGIPVPASTQWDVVSGRIDVFRPVHQALVWLSAQASVFYSDDSYMRILEYMGKRRAALLAKDELAKASCANDEPVKIELPDPERTGLFTSAIVSTSEVRPTILLFFTGRKHAGENLALLLSKRAADLPTPIQMSDALSRNLPKGYLVLESNCLAHGRRKLVDELDNYPVECHFVLEKLAHVFAVDKKCREEGLSSAERLKVHQRDSAPAMAEIREYMTQLLADKVIEPNSGLGEAFNYFLKRWDNFTLFLRVHGAPLDNNICERALKMAIRHRNNSLSYRNAFGAEVGDIYMSLIYTTVLAGENPFDYLTALQRHAKDVAENPTAWLPWNYRETLAQRGEIVPARPVSRLSKPPPATQPRAPPAEDITLQEAA
jgi:hypothetical protein